MRVLFVTHQFMPEFAAGTESVALALAMAARRAGHRADVLTHVVGSGAEWPASTPEGFAHAAVSGLSVNAIPRAMTHDTYGFEPAIDGALVSALDRLLDREQYDLVHVMHAMRGVGVIEHLQARLPTILTLTDFFLLCYRVNLVRSDLSPCAGPAGGRACAEYCGDGGIDAAGLRRRQARVGGLLRAATERVAGSAFVADAFRREHPDVPIRMIGHGIDALGVASTSVPGTGNAASAGPVFGYVGTLAPGKGVDMLVEAFRHLDCATARLELVGPLAGGQAFAAELRANLRADPRIRLHGSVPAEEIGLTMAGFDVLCLPSRLPETFSLALHEGFAAGLPCLVSDLGHPASTVRAHGCGAVVPADDPDAWADALRDVAQHPDRLAGWRAQVPLPRRVEEEAFLYGQLYRACLTAVPAADGGKAC